MGIFLSICFILLEVVLMVFSFSRFSEKKQWLFASIVFLVMSLIPSFIFAEYAGLETTGEYETGEAAAILIDKNRVETFETDGSNREIPMHFYYPKTDENLSGSYVCE